MDTPKESASSPTGTPTGRIKSDSLIDFMDRWMGHPTPTYLREPMAVLENSPEIPIISGMDFGELEARTVAMLVGQKDGHLTIHKILEGDFYQGLKADLVIIDDITPIIGPELFDLLSDNDFRALPEPEEREYRKPVKQNGRDASYLALDPTKRHGRRRR